MNRRRTSWLVAAMLVTMLVAAGCGTGSSQPPATGNEAPAGDADPAPADGTSEPETWEPGGRVELIIPFSPGGGYDAYGRAVAEEAQKRLPAGVRIDVKNVTGAGGNVGAETLKRARPDGLTLGMVHNIQVAGQQIYDGPNATLDVTEDFAWVTGITAEPYILFSGANSGINSFEDLINLDRPLRMAGTGAIGVPTVIGTILEAEFGIEVHNLTAYAGAGDAMTAIVRGDADAAVFEASSIYSFVEAGDFIPLVVLDNEPSALFPGTPVSADVGLAGAVVLSMRPLGLPAGTPEPILEYWRNVFREAMHDPNLIKWSEEAKREIAYRSPDEVSQTVAGMMEFLLPHADAIVKAIEEIGE